MVVFDDTTSFNERTKATARPGLIGRRGSSFRRLTPPTVDALQSLVDAHLSQSSASTSSILNPLRLLVPPSTNGDEIDDQVKAVDSLQGLYAGLSDALKWSISKNDVEILTWLVELRGEPADVLDKIATNFRDDDHQTIIGMAIVASAGQEAREATVRTLVNRFGVLWPPAKDEIGKTIPTHSWTPLHFAALLASPPLVSFLLTRGCDPAWTTSKGLTALDIVEGMPGRDDVTDLLQGVGEAAAMVTPNPSGVSSSPAGPSNLRDEMVGEIPAVITSTPRTDFSPNLSITTEEANEEVGQQDIGLRDRRAQALERHRRFKRAATKRRMRKEKRALEDEQVDLAVRMRLLNMGMAGDDAAYLMRGYESRWAGNRAQIRIKKMVRDDDSDEEQDDESESDADSIVEVDDGLAELVDGFEDAGTDRHVRSMDQDVELNSDDGEVREDDTLQSRRTLLKRIDEASFLVCDTQQIESILDVVVSNYDPQCYPLTRRTLPANTIFLLTRYAVYRCPDQPIILHSVLEGACIAIEEVCHNRRDSLVMLAFWTYNLTILVFLVQNDPLVMEECEDRALLEMLQELLNLFQIHITRCVEGTMHRVLESSMLDCETIDEDVQFDDQWSLFKSLTGRKKPKSNLPHVAGIFGQSPGSPNPTASPGGRAARSSLQIETRLDNAMNTTPSRSARQAGSVFQSAVGGDSPTTMIDVLSGTLLVLELYEINPALIIQIFSQLLSWMAAEMFNGIMTGGGGKRYLCRSKALQIKMNLEFVAEWVKASSLPSSLYTKHFERVLQLLQWLQCCSQISDFDMLIATVPQLTALNPIQLRRAVKDYRHEVDEPRMSEECAQYLMQLVRDWDRKRVVDGVEGIHREVSQRQVSRSGTPETQAELSRQAAVRSLDGLFDVDVGLADYQPSLPAPSQTDLEDSRYPIPFVIPSQEYLSAVPLRQQYFGSLFGMSMQARPDGRPSSPTSYSSASPMAYTIRTARQVQRKPEDFIEWLSVNQQAANARIRQAEPRMRTAPAEMHVAEKPSRAGKLLNRNSYSALSEPQSQDIYAHPRRTPSHSGSPITPTVKRYLDPYEAATSPSPTPQTPTRSPPASTPTRSSWLSGFSLRRASGMSQAATSQDGSWDDGETPMAEMNEGGRTLWGR